VTGFLPSPTPKLAKVGLVSETVPSSWSLLGLSSLHGLDLLWNVVCATPDCAPTDLRQAVPVDGLVIKKVDTMSHALTAKDMVGLGSVDILLFDGARPPHVKSSFWLLTTVKWVVATRTPRGQLGLLRDRWSTASAHLDHSQLGGVTDWRGSVFSFMRRPQDGTALPSWPSPSRLITARFHELVDVTEKGRPTPAPTPGSLELADPDFQVALLPMSLLGRSVHHSISVKVPSVFSPTKYCLRPLTYKEQLLALDVPATLIKGQPDTNLLLLAARTLTPVKALNWIGNHLGLTIRNWPYSDGVAAGATKRLALPVHRDVPHPSSKRRRRHSSGDAVCLEGGYVGGVVGDPFLPTALDTRLRFASYVPWRGDLGTNIKAAKGDDAEIPTFMWDDRLAFLLGQQSLTDDQVNRLQPLRNACWSYWLRRVRLSWRRWWGEHKLLLQQQFPSSYQDIGRAGINAVAYASRSSFWDWRFGSAVFFWRWKPEYQLDLALGHPPRWVGPEPDIKAPQRGLGSQDERDKLRAKVSKFIERGYLRFATSEEVTAVINYFFVAKGEDDIRPVFDGTKNGLNAALWAPWFMLPKTESLVRILDIYHFCSDNDYGEMFYNFWLHPDLRRFCAIDGSPLFPELASQNPGGHCFLVWNRPPMGVTFSPYQATQFGRRLKVATIGRHDDPYNVFAWARVEVNLPGTPGYQPGQPWISKRRQDGRIAVDMCEFVDDYRFAAPSAELCWEASSKQGKTCSFHGCQDALRKRRLQSQNPGAWAGARVSTEGSIRSGVTQDRWDKTKREIAAIRQEYTASRAPVGDTLIDYGRLESAVGFLIYVSRVYPTLRVYLTEMYNTLNGWRPDRDKDGWRVYALKLECRAEREWRYESDSAGAREVLEPRAPARVAPSEGFLFALEGLETLTAPSDAPMRLVRPPRDATAIYSAGDSSKAGFGSAAWGPTEPRTSFHFGTWVEFVRNKSSNYRELAGVGLRLEMLHAQGKLVPEIEYFIFTDNFVTESCHTKSTARSRELFELMLRIHKLQLHGGVFIHVIWYAGTRMIENGIDGLSRGDFSNGIMSGGAMLDYVPIGKTALERRPSLVDLLRTLAPPAVEFTLLEPSMWFTKPFHEDGVFVWTPAPAIADVAFELLAESHQIRPWNTHVFLAPSLMTSRWRKDLTKATDIRVTLPFCDVHWPKSSEHEPLTLAIAFPLLRRQPWRVKRASFLQQQGPALRQLPKSDFPLAWDRLRKLWLQVWEMEPVPSGLAR
jgi:hypothetical protein